MRIFLLVYLFLPALTWYLFLPAFVWHTASVVCIDSGTDFPQVWETAVFKRVASSCVKENDHLFSIETSEQDLLHVQVRWADVNTVRHWQNESVRSLTFILIISFIWGVGLFLLFGLVWFCCSCNRFWEVCFLFFDHDGNRFRSFFGKTGFIPASVFLFQSLQSVFCRWFTFITY